MKRETYEHLTQLNGAEVASKVDNNLCSGVGGVWSVGVGEVGRLVSEETKPSWRLNEQAIVQSEA